MPERGDKGGSLAEWMDRQFDLSAAAMLQCVSAVHLVKSRPAFGQMIRPTPGSVLASPTIAAYDPDPDYFFHWLRDSAVVVDALATLIEDGRDLRGHVRDFVGFSLALNELDGRNGRAPVAADPNFQQYLRSREDLNAAVGDNLLGETRFNPDGTLDITRWARPQHDGPALRALTIMRIWRLGLFDDVEGRDAARRLIEADLAFANRRWNEPSFDIWEEELGHHYYTRLVQHAALSDGADWLDETGDPQAARDCREASREIARRLDDYWDESKGFYRSRVGVSGGNPEKELDIAVVLGVIHARREAGAHSVRDLKAQATLARLENLFARDYPINRPLPGDRGPAMGRYAGDGYYSGGAYYFATLAAAEFCYRLAAAVARDGRADDAACGALIRRGDCFMATVRAYTPTHGELSEQFDRATGEQTSSKNLAWSHAALITAVAARRAADQSPSIKVPNARTT